MIVSKNSSFCVISSFFIFLISLFIYPNYYNGDQEHYRLFYNSVSNYSLIEGFGVYFSSLGSLEPTYFLVVYFLSPILDKDLLFSFLNGVLFFLFAKIMVKLKVSKYIITIYAFNFYFLVLFFAAERLKIGFIIFFLALILTSRVKVFFLGFSIASHLQMIIASLIYLIVNLSNDLQRIVKGKFSYRMIFMLFTVLLFTVLLIPLKEQIILKFTFYYQNSDGAAELIKPFIFYFLTLPYAKGKVIELTLITILLLLIVFFVGSDRLVMFSFIVFSYYSLKSKRGLNFGVLFVNSYFLFKSYLFIQAVITCGEAFSCFS